MKVPNRTNSNFQIAYFLAGACHTPDGAYAQLCNLRESREMALEEAKWFSLKRVFNRILGRVSSVEKKCYDAAVAELEFINKCIAAVQPYRKYADLPDPEAHEMSQRDEWRYELISRAENHLLTSGMIPADHFVTMRLHPDFKEFIAPSIIAMGELLSKDGGKEQMLTICANKNFNLPLLLEEKCQD